jgi:hypothetical protein
MTTGPLERNSWKSATRRCLVYPSCEMNPTDRFEASDSLYFIFNGPNAEIGILFRFSEKGEYVVGWPIVEAYAFRDFDNYFSRLQRGKEAEIRDLRPQLLTIG